jgi:hypothetical protein
MRRKHGRDDAVDFGGKNATSLFALAALFGKSRSIQSLSRLLLIPVLFVFVLFVLPLGARALWFVYQNNAAASWSQANWSSAGLLPPAEAGAPALIRIYAARTGRWRGVVAHHSWIVVKEEGAARYSRFDKVGWGSPVRTDGWAPDARWFSHEPETVLAIDGAEAARLIPRIREAVADYPHGGARGYRAWPGPNSNTFVAHVAREVPELRASLPSTALGKDWTPERFFVGRTISGTGLRVSVAGYAGLAVGWVEGIEINLMGLVAGIDPRRLGIKLPGWGDMRLIGDASAIGEFTSSRNARSRIGAS